jgi:thymidine phosphorylase
MCLHKPGEEVEPGEPVLVLHCDDPARLEGALAALDGALEVGPEPPEPRPLVVDRIA